MKHLSKLAAILAALVLACAFFSCSDGNSSDDQSDDQSISLSDGDYTLKIKLSDDADGMVEEHDIRATASNDSWTFMSGSGTVTVDLTKQMTTDELATFNAKSDNEKKAMVREEMDTSADAVISFNGNKVIVTSNHSTSDLAVLQEDYPLSSIPADAKIETIKDKTEYKVTMFMNGMQMEFHIKKD